MSNPQKHGAGGKIPDFTGFQVAQFQGSDFFLGRIENFVNHGVLKELNLFILTRPVKHDFRCPKLVAAMDERNFVGKTRQERRLFHGGVSAADHSYIFAGEKEPIASCARGDTVPDKGLLAGQSQPARRSAAGNNESARKQRVFAHLHGERALAQVGAGGVAVPVFRAKALCLAAHVIHQFRSLDAFRKTWEIFHQRS